MKLLQICAVILLYVAADLHQKRPPDPIKWKQEIKPQQRALYFAVPFFLMVKVIIAAGQRDILCP